MASKHPGSHGDESLRLVLIGKTGAGKSKTGNTILGRDVFRSVTEASSVTGKCQLGRGFRGGRNIQIVDTPGLFDTGLTQDQVADEIRKCVAMSAPGPHAIVLVTSIGRFTKEESDTVDFFRQMFGEGVTRHLVLLFTRRDDLDDEGVTIEDYLTRIPETLASLLQLCGRRYVAFNNRAPPDDKAAQVQQLLQVVDGLVEENAGDCYTSEMFEKAEEIMRQREEELRKEHDAERLETRETLEKWRTREAEMREDYHREAREMSAKMAALQSTQTAGGGEEAARLRGELEEIKQLVAVLKESHDQETERLQSQIRGLEERASQPPPNFRYLAQDQVCQESPGILSTLKKGLQSVIDCVFHTIGPAIGHGVGKVVEKGFKKVLKK